MGRPKAWLEVGSRTLLDVLVEVLAPVCDPVVVVGRRGQALPKTGAPVHYGTDPAAYDGQGPLAGLLAGIRVLHAEGVDIAFVGACDQALLTTRHVAFMVDALGDADMVCVDEPGRGLEPLGGVLRVQPALAAAERSLRGSARSLRAFARAMDTHTVTLASVPDPDVFTPCNTPGEWARIVARLVSAG